MIPEPEIEKKIEFGKNYFISLLKESLNDDKSHTTLINRLRYYPPQYKIFKGDCAATEMFEILHQYINHSHRPTLHYFIKAYENSEAVNILLNEKKEENKNEVFFWSACKGQVKLISELLEKDTIDIKEHTINLAIISAIANKNFTVADIIMKNFPALSEKYNSLLFIESALYGNLTATFYFYSMDDLKKAEALDKASQKGHLPLVEFFIKNNQFSPYSLGIAFWGAAIEGQIDILKFFLEKCNIQASYKNNGFAEAAGNGHLATVKLLFDAVSDDAKNNAFSLAASNNEISIVKHFLDSDAELKNSTITNAFKTANLQKSLKLIELLIEFCPNKIEKNLKKTVFEENWKQAQFIFNLVMLKDPTICNLIEKNEIKFSEYSKTHEQSEIDIFDIKAYLSKKINVTNQESLYKEFKEHLFDALELLHKNADVDFHKKINYFKSLSGIRENYDPNKSKNPVSNVQKLLYCFCLNLYHIAKDYQHAFSLAYLANDIEFISGPLYKSIPKNQIISRDNKSFSSCLLQEKVAASIEETINKKVTWETAYQNFQKLIETLTSQKDQETPEQESEKKQNKRKIS